MGGATGVWAETHAEGGHPEWPSEDRGGAERADWWDSKQHDSEPVNHTKREKHNRLGVKNHVRIAANAVTSTSKKQLNCLM